MILLDTHIVIWLALTPEKLSKLAAASIQKTRDNHEGLSISCITLYELSLLSTKRRVDYGMPLEPFLNLVESLFIVKPITGRICAETMRLPESYPKDPMDRMIGATALVEGLTLVTADAAIRRSKAVATLW